MAALTADPEHGGQGLPTVVATSVAEIFNAANWSFGMYAGVANGAYSAIKAHGSEAQRQLYLPKLVVRRMGGHDGSDRAARRHRSRPAAHAAPSRMRRQLPDHRQQDLHLGRRAGPHRQHRPSRARQDPRRPGRLARHLAVSGSEVSAQPGRRVRARATACRAAASSTRWASMAAPPA